MGETFNTRRDSSTNNVPTVGYNEGVDAQDVILFGACKVTEALTTDGTGTVTLSNYPVSVTGDVFTDATGIRRGRNVNNDITITSATGTTTYYAGSVSILDKTLKVYTSASRTTVVTGASVLVTYYKRVPVKFNEDGEMVIEGQASGTQDVNIASSAITVPVAIKSSDVALTETKKAGIMLKKEGAIAAGASANELTWAIGDSTKEAYITSIIGYYNGTDATTDPRVGCWFDILASDGTSVGTMDLTIPARANGMLQLDFGPVGLKLAVGSKFRFRVGSTWVANTIHVIALGWQYTS